MFRLYVLMEDYYCPYMSSMQLPMGSAAQQAALQCYCLRFKPQDHSFLLQSNVFTNVSKALSLTEESQDTTPQEKKMRDRVSQIAAACTFWVNMYAQDCSEIFLSNACIDRYLNI